MSDELTGTATAIFVACNFLGALALFGGDCFNLTLMRKSRRFFERLYARSGISLNASWQRSL